MRVLGTMLCVVIGACYGPSYRDCEVLCSSGNGCPSGLTCDSLNRCRVAGAGPTCGSVQLDAPGNDAADATDASDAAAVCSPPVDIVAFGYHTCIRRADGNVACWGDNMFGESGAASGTTCPTRPCNPLPTRIGLPAEVSTLGLGAIHTCATLVDGRMFCWGNNQQSQFGNGIPGTTFAPVDVNRSGASAIATGDEHTCTLTNGSITCSGDNTYGEVGDGTLMQRQLPVLIQGFSATAIASGLWHMCAIQSANGSVYCWGKNDEFQSGPGSTPPPITMPRQVSSSTIDVLALALGSRHSCFIRSTRDVRCFGDNSFGQLGTGVVDASVHGPIGVIGLTDVQEIAANADHTCAIKLDGSVWCWGDVNGTATATPTRVVLPRSATKVAVGLLHACALLDDETVECWGDNLRGQHGDGTHDTTLTATRTVVCDP